MADTKLADLTADTSPTIDDLMYAVNDPSGTPADRKVALGDLLKFITGLTADTSPTTDDLVATINDPSGTPAVRKVTLANLLSLQNVVQIQQIVTASSQATVDFTSIPSGYTTLKVIYIAQDTQSGTGATALNLKVNNDSTAGNYTSTFRVGVENITVFTSQVAAGSSGVWVGLLPQSGNTGIASSGEVTLSGYLQTTFHKPIHAWFTNEFTTGDIGSCYARWKATTAISRLTFSPGGTAFTDGSIFTLYGIR